MSNAASRTDASETATQNARTYVYRLQNGDLIGGNYVIPRGDFAAFLGYAPPTKAESSGNRPVSGSRVIELALQREFETIGRRSTVSGQSHRNQVISWRGLTSEPGRERDMLRVFEDAVSEGWEKRTDKLAPAGLGEISSARYMTMLEEYHRRSRQDNMRYLEMQYKIRFSTLSHSTVSNLMKVRHDATVRAIRESR